MHKGSPSSIITSLANRYTTKMSADTQHDQPLGLLRSLFVTLRVSEGLPFRRAGLFDLCLHYALQGRIRELGELVAPATYLALAPFIGGEQAALIATEAPQG